MARIKIDKDKCKSCMLCAAVCPRELIVRSRNLNRRGIYYVEFKTKRNKGGCTACGMCAIICPEACIEVYK